MKHETYYSRRLAKEKAAIEAFDKVMKEYGLEAERTISGEFKLGQYVYQAKMETKWVRIKGHAKTIKQLQADGWSIQKKMRPNSIGIEFTNFRVHGYCDIPIVPDDILEYTDPAQIADVLPLEIRKRK